MAAETHLPAWLTHAILVLAGPQEMRHGMTPCKPCLVVSFEGTLGSFPQPQPQAIPCGKPASFSASQNQKMREPGSSHLCPPDTAASPRHKKTQPRAAQLDTAPGAFEEVLLAKLHLCASSPAIQLPPTLVAWSPVVWWCERVVSHLPSTRTRVQFHHQSNN